MPLPDIHDIYRPLLEVLRDEAPHNLSINDLMDITAEHFGLGELSTIDRNLFKQRITHAKKELLQKKFLTNPADNMYIITSAGLNYLDNPEESESEIKPEAVIPEESHTEVQEEIPDEVPEVIESESDIELEKLESELEEHEEIQTEPKYEEIDPEEDDAQEEFEEIAELPELEDVPEIPDDEEITEVHEVNDESEDIKLEDETEDFPAEEKPEEGEPETFPAEEEHEDESEDIKLEDETENFPVEKEPEGEPESEETIEETSGDGIIMEDEAETEQYETPSEGEDIAESPEPEPEPEPELPPEETHESDESENTNEEMNMNPSTGIEDAIRTYNEELAGKILSGISELPTEMFEVFVIDMLSKMGYRAFQNARYTSEETGSNLIHGVIIDDKTGAPIYIHARKSSPNKTIGRADMQDFIDALSDKGGKGVFATTGKFSEQAEVLANDERIMLIDGLKLAGLMISHNFCVKVEKVYEIKDFDAESFKDYQK